MPMTIAELKNAQRVAGARYAAAVREWQEAYVELAALDRTLANSNVAGNVGEPVKTFHDFPTNLGSLAHPVFCTSAGSDNWNAEIQDLHERWVLEFHTKGL